MFLNRKRDQKIYESKQKQNKCCKEYIEIDKTQTCVILGTWETRAGRLTLFFIGGANPPD
jgi:hypothetical protein